jgi:hypothetical protein
VPDEDRPNDLDLGDPVRELRELREEPAIGFVQRLRGRIQRRLFAADSVDFGLRVMFQTLMDYVDLFLAVVSGGVTRKGRNG